MEDDKIVLDRKSFEALAVDSRVKILKSLKERRKTLSELAKEQDMSVSGVKEHLETLEKVDLIAKIDDGHKWKYYELTKKGSDIIGPKELRVWILLSLSSVALILSIFAMLPTQMASEMAVGGTDFVADNAPASDAMAATAEDGAELRLMTAATEEASMKSVPMAEEPKQDLAPILVAGISIVTMVACMTILARNRLKSKATV
jgi:DNA-binding transcriptional ArsR family regulator